MSDQSMWPALRRKFPADEFCLLEEVRDAAGFHASNSADFIAIGLWPSRGLEVIGIERKSYRGDWLRELKNPKKAEAIYQYCDRWFLLADDETVAKQEELPVTWGFMVLKKGKIAIIKEAPKLSPVAIDRSFLAALLKRATKGLFHPSTIEDRIKDAKESGKAEVQRTIFDTERKHEVLLKAVKKFEEHSGVSIYSRYEYHNAEEVGKAVRYVMNNGMKDFVHDLEIQKRSIEMALVGLDKMLSDMKALKKSQS